MVEKRLKKFEFLRKEFVPPTLYGNKNAPSIVLCWGSNKLIVKEAIEKLTQEGINVAAMHFCQVYPLTADIIAPYRLEEKNLICVENNARGQFAGLLKRELGINVAHPVLKYNGECFTVEELFQTLKSILR